MKIWGAKLVGVGQKLGSNSGSKNFWEEFFGVKFHSRKERILGSKMFWRGNMWGAKFLTAKKKYSEGGGGGGGRQTLGRKIALG